MVSSSPQHHHTSSRFLAAPESSQAFLHQRGEIVVSNIRDQRDGVAQKLSVRRRRRPPRHIVPPAVTRGVRSQSERGPLPWSGRTRRMPGRGVEGRDCRSPDTSDTVTRAHRPPGRASGQLSTSPRARSADATGCGLPPAAETRNTPAPTEKRMVYRPPQLARRNRVPTEAMRTATAPASDQEYS